MSRFSPGFIFPPPAGALSSFAFLAGAVNGASQTPNSVLTQNFGTADPNRWLIAFITGGLAVRTFTSCTIGTISATKLADSNNAGAGLSRICSIWAAHVPLGTSGDIVINMSGGESCGFALWGVNSPTGLTVVEAQEFAGGGNNTFAINTAPGGLLLGGVCGAATSAALGGDFDTQDVNQVTVNSYTYRAAHKAALYTGTSGSYTLGNLGSITSACVVSLKPT